MIASSALLLAPAVWTILPRYTRSFFLPWDYPTISPSSRTLSGILSVSFPTERQNNRTSRPPPEARKLFLAATTAVMGGVPSRAVMMTDPGFSVTAARPVVAGHVLASREGRAVRLRASQDIVPVSERIRYRGILLPLSSITVMTVNRCPMP